MEQNNLNEENKNTPQQKYIIVNYKNISKKVSYFGDLDVKEFKNQVKELFEIYYTTENLLFKTNNDDLIILNKNIPSFLKLNLFHFERHQLLLANFLLLHLLELNFPPLN